MKNYRQTTSELKKIGLDVFEHEVVLRFCMKKHNFDLKHWNYKKFKDGKIMVSTDKFVIKYDPNDSYTGEVSRLSDEETLSFIKSYLHHLKINTMINLTN